MEPRWEDLNTIAAVVKTGSVTAAARELGLAQSTVSRRIANAELDLDVQLWKRSSRGMMSTGLAVAISDAITLAEPMLAHAMRFPSPLPRRLRVGTYVVSHGEIAALFGDLWPDVEWELVDDSYDDLSERFNAGALDVYVGLQTPYHEHLKAVHRYDVFRDPLCVAVPVNHPLAHRTNLTLADFANENWVVSPDAAIGRLFREACIHAGFEPRIPYRTDRSRSVQDLVAAGRAVSLCVPLTTADSAIVVRQVSGLPNVSVAIACALPGIEVTAELTNAVRGWYLRRASEVPAYWQKFVKEVDGLWPDPPRATKPVVVPHEAWSDAQAVLALGKTSSLTAAAAQLRCSEATVARAVHRLGRRMGRYLVTPKTRPLQLTIDGFILLSSLLSVEAVLHGIGNMTRWVK
ncbi:LysR family transcriptional regulator [Micromonospora sp. BQ11]|uniref:LysR family transcriptional regulator n=1 Tax=Micromonospora sp. BQ11 TaxID=3452212 RepID=UPI003F892278